MKLLQNCVMTQLVCCDNILVGSYCNNVSCIVIIIVVTRKVCRERVLSPLNLISYCNFIFYVATYSSGVVRVLCRDLVFMSRQDILPMAHLFVATKCCCVAIRPLFIVLKSFLGDGKVRRDLVYLCSTYFCVVTLISMWQHQNFSLA